MTPELSFRIVRRHEAGVSTWGDDVAGKVDDLIYGRPDSSGLYLCHSTLKAGRHFTLSDSCWPVSEGWNAIHVLRGCFLAYEPFTHEAVEVEAGATLFVPPRVWHFGRAIGGEDVEMLEFITPPTPGVHRSALVRPVISASWLSYLGPSENRRLLRGAHGSLSVGHGVSPILISTNSWADKLERGTWCYIDRGMASLAANGTTEQVSTGDAAFVGNSSYCRLFGPADARVVNATLIDF